MVAAPGSEEQFQAELNLARGGRCRCDDASGWRWRGACGRVHDLIRSAEVCVVQDIEELRTKLRPQAFGDLGFLAQRRVEICKAWACERIASGVAVGSGGRNQVSAGIEILRRAALDYLSVEVGIERG